jgi:hypothetical protein
MVGVEFSQKSTAYTRNGNRFQALFAGTWWVQSPQRKAPLTLETETAFRHCLLEPSRQFIISFEKRQGVMVGAESSQKSTAYTRNGNNFQAPFAGTLPPTHHLLRKTRCPSGHPNFVHVCHPIIDKPLFFSRNPRKV